MLLGVTALTADRKDSVTTLTGMLDQRGDNYVLASEDAMKTEAVLQASGFSADNFARFVGARVQVRGELRTEGERRVLVVRRLEDLKKLPRTQP
jgi:hypothetical protein